jgi:hypothetical protein
LLFFFEQHTTTHCFLRVEIEEVGAPVSAALKEEIVFINSAAETRAPTFGLVISLREIDLLERKRIFSAYA